MDRRMSRSMPLLLFTPICYTPPACYRYRDLSPRWPDRRGGRPRHYYVGGVRTQLIGADSYPNPFRSPRRMILCGGSSGSSQKMTRSSSTAELSRSGVYCSREDLRYRDVQKRAASCEDVVRGKATTTPTWDSRLSESGVSLNDSRCTDLGSYVGLSLEDVDGASQCSFGSSSAFHEITCDSEMDRQDSDCLSVPGSGYGRDGYYDRPRDFTSHDSDSRGRRRDRGSSGGGHQAAKSRHDSGSREKFLAELSGRSSPQEGEEKEFFHSTPTKRGSPVLSIFPADDEDDLHFPSRLPKHSLLQEDSLLQDSLHQSSADSLLSPATDSLPDKLSSESSPGSPTSSRSKDKKPKAKQTPPLISTNMEAVKAALKRQQQRQQQQQQQQEEEEPLFSSLQDCSRTQSAGESVQSWLTTGHPHTSPQQQHHHGQSPSPPPSEGLSVRDRVRALEQGFQAARPVEDQTASHTHRKGSPPPQRRSSEEEGTRRGGGSNSNNNAAASISTLAEGGGAKTVSSSSQYSPASETSSVGLLNNAPGTPTSSSDRGEKKGGGGTSYSEAEREKSSFTNNDGRFNELSLPNEKHSTALSSTSFESPGRREEENQPSGERASVGSGSTTSLSGLRGSDSARLGIINTGAGADQLWSEANCWTGVSSRDDRNANTAGADTATTARPPHTRLASAAASSTSTLDVYQTGIEEAETTTGTTTDEYSTQDREFESLVSGFSDAEDFNDDDVNNDIAEIESGSRKGCDSATLYHARRIQIVSPGGDDLTPSTLPPGDSPPSSSSLFHGGDSALDGDDADAEVQSLLKGLNPQQAATLSGDWQQEDVQTSTGMEYQFQTPHPAWEEDAAALGVMTVREVSQHHTKHVHRKRTTVQEMVTTRHTSVRHHTGSPSHEGDKTVPTYPGDHYNNDGEDFEMTDKTVSRITITEHDNEIEERTTRKTTRLPGSCLENEYSSTSFQTPAESDSGVKLTIQQQHPGGSSYREEARAMLVSTPDHLNDSVHLLDNLREQLSVLDPTVDSGASPTHSLQPVSGYKDRAEASLPQAESTTLPTSTSSLVRGTGSVFITLDRSGPQEGPELDVLASERKRTGASDWATDGISDQASRSGPEGHLYHARAVQILPTGETVCGQYTEGREDLAASSHPSTSSWGLTGSSSEINDSDDRCTSVSSSQRPHPYTDSDSCVEGDSTTRAFQDFLPGLQGQFTPVVQGQFTPGQLTDLTSDQPSLHRSVDMIVDDLPPAHLLQSALIHEPILEADDEVGTSEEEDLPLSPPVIDSYKSSLHFSVPEASPSSILSVMSVSKSPQQITSGDRAHHTLSSEHPLQDLSHQLSTLSDAFDEHHVLHASTPRNKTDFSFSRHAHPISPVPSDNTEAGIYSTCVSAEVHKATEKKKKNTAHKLPEPIPTHSLTSRRLITTYKGPKRSQWVQDKVLLFQKLLNDFDWQSKSPEQKLMEEEMVAMDAAGRGRGEDPALEKQSSDGFCDDLYKLFTRENLEMRQNHVCPAIEDHMPAFRFRRFLRKKHNSKLKGHKTVQVRHQLEGLSETSHKPDTGHLTTGDPALTQTRQPPYHIHHLSPAKLRGRFVSDVFTEDADVNRSTSSDSAYSSLSGTLSRNVSDLGSTFRSVTGSRADVSSIGADASLDEDKLRSLSEVFDHPGVYEGDVDTARLDRLQVGHHKAETL